jgi:hypothetical protein
MSSAMRSDDSGACSGDLTTTVLPAASGAPIFIAANMSGWLYATMRATTPSGSRSV